MIFLVFYPSCAGQICGAHEGKLTGNKMKLVFEIIFIKNKNHRYLTCKEEIKPVKISI